MPGPRVASRLGPRGTVRIGLVLVSGAILWLLATIQPKIDDLSNQLIWETRIFEDRRRVIKFVCEVPTAIDQRLFALGRVIQQEME